MNPRAANWLDALFLEGSQIRPQENYLSANDRTGSLRTEHNAQVRKGTVQEKYA
jgi:hypothetical protein